MCANSSDLVSIVPISILNRVYFSDSRNIFCLYNGINQSKGKGIYRYV